VTDSADGRVRLAIVFGGRSTEHAISCISAGSVLAALDRDRYDVVAIGITPDGRWVLAPDDPAALTMQGRELPSVAAGGTALAIPGDPSVHGLVVLDAAAPPRVLGGVDVVFPLLHGPYGEDGTIQGLLDLAGIPYVGAGVLPSAVAMDKEYMKLLFAARGLPVAEHLVVFDRDWQADHLAVLARIPDLFALPVFVKPARGGSSLGITRVTEWAGLAQAMEVARQHDPKVLVEAAVDGREIECGVLDGEHGGPPETSVPAEILVRGRDFYDFEAKYHDEAGTEFAVPAELTAAQSTQVRDLAVRAFRAVGCEGLARVDFFLCPDGSWLVNELNTMPGFTPASMFPRMWEATGLGYPQLVDRLVRNALARGSGLR
jgi:D-alanine-D-alanine ligase